MNLDTVLAVVVDGKPHSLGRMPRKLALNEARKMAHLHTGVEYRVYVGWNSETDTGQMVRSITCFRGK